MNNTPGPGSPQINATVMASAGTGKTWLLVSRLLRLLLHGARADAILAITFTRKAAAEMQTRLAERLFELAAADDGELAELLRELSVAPDADTMTRARGLYEELLQSGKSVRTTTFHAFCQDILRRFPLEADVPPGFELLESDGETARTAMELLVEQATLQPEGDTAQALQALLAYCGGLNGLEQALYAFLAHRGDWWAYTEGQDAPHHFAAARLKQQLGIGDDDDPLTALFSSEMEQALADYAELLGRHPIKSNQDRLALLADARNPELETGQRFAQCREALLTKRDEPRACKESKTQAAKMGVDGQERFIALHQQLAAALIATLDQLAAVATHAACDNWYRVGAELLEIFQRLKAERRQLDFTDLEWRAYRLLNRTENAQWVQFKLDQRIEHLLVDEFQDTNPTQWYLLQPLLQEMAAGEAERHRTVFLVGDAKQSIYRFRRAEPRLFQAAHEWLEQHLDARGYPLHTSWRSAPAIMQGVNKLFGDGAPLQRVLRDFTLHDTHLQEMWGSVTVMPLIQDLEEGIEEEAETPATLRNPLHQPRIIPGDERYRREGEMIAAEIERLVAEQAPVGKGGDVRPMRYGDVMILVRSRSNVGEYEQALRRADIPYLGAERGTLLESLEVRDMVALLELLITPYNNLSLAQVLRSPLFACSDEALMQLAAMEHANGTWFQRLATVAEDDTNHPLHRPCRLLYRWHALVGKLPIHDLLDRIYNEGNVLARYRAAYPPHLQSRSESNLTRFLELALAIDSGRYPSLGRFLSRLGEMREHNDEAPDEAPSGDSDRVRVMTIHASKGLEAPVVFLADSARNGGNERPFRALVDWPAEAPRPNTLLLVGKKGQQDRFTREALEREKEEERREDANLLYVAVTRARQHLYLSACAPRRGDGLGWYGAMRQALDPLEEHGLDESCRLESNAPPPLVQTAITHETAETPSIPVALSQPLDLGRRSHELAPSYQKGGGAAHFSSGDEDGLQRGIAIHRMLELLTETGAADTHAVTQRVAGELGIAAGNPELLEWEREVQGLFDAAALQELLQPGDSDALNEVPVLYQQQGQTVHGIIDRLLLRNGEAWVIDYKSHRGVETDTIAEHAEPFRRQLDYYAEGVKKIWPQRAVRRFILFTHCQALYEFN